MQYGILIASYLFLTGMHTMINADGNAPINSEMQAVIKYVLDDMKDEASHVLSPKEKYLSHIDVVLGPKHIFGFEEKDGDEKYFEIKFDIRLKERYGNPSLGWIKIKQHSYTCGAAVKHHPKIGFAFQKPTVCSRFSEHPKHLEMPN